MTQSIDPRPNVEKLLYSRKEAAYALGVSLRTIDYMIANKRLAFRKFGGKILIPVNEVRRVSRMDHTIEELRGTKDAVRSL